MLKHYFNRWESLQEEITRYLFMKAKTGLRRMPYEGFYNIPK